MATTRVSQVPATTLPYARFSEVLTSEQFARLDETVAAARELFATSVGGIQDQIVDGHTGVLVDPDDVDAFGAAAAGLLRDRARASELGDAARERVRDQFLGPRTLWQYFDLFQRVLPDGSR